MKKRSALLLAGMFILAVTTHAQNGFYLAPSIGAGIGSQTGSYSAFNANGDNITKQKSSVFSYNAQIGIGYRYKNWRFQSGIQYMSNGYKMDELTFGSDFNPFNPITGSGIYDVRLTQIGIPLQVSYAIPLSSRFTLVPGIGFMGTYLISGKSTLQQSTGTVTDDWNSQMLKNYGRLTMWGLANVQLEYKINDKISLFGGPSVQYELGQLDNGTRGNQRAFNIHFNAGLRINLK